MVVCHPGTRDMAKSKDTTECTDSTSGVENAARKRYARAKCRHSLSVLRQPRERTLKMRFLIGLIPSRSRRTAMSGINPTYRNVLETVRQVRIATPSDTSG